MSNELDRSLITQAGRLYQALAQAGLYAELDFIGVEDDAIADLAEDIVVRSEALDGLIQEWQTK